MTVDDLRYLGVPFCPEARVVFAKSFPAGVRLCEEDIRFALELWPKKTKRVLGRLLSRDVARRVDWENVSSLPKEILSIVALRGVKPGIFFQGAKR